MRSAVDLDLLVPAELLDSAVETIGARGYSLQRDAGETNGRPATAPPPHPRRRPAASGRASLAHPLVRDALLARHARSQPRNSPGPPAAAGGRAGVFAALLCARRLPGHAARGRRCRLVGPARAAGPPAAARHHGGRLSAAARRHGRRRHLARGVGRRPTRGAAFGPRPADLASTHRHAPGELGGRRGPRSGERERHPRRLAGRPSQRLAGVRSSLAVAAAGQARRRCTDLPRTPACAGSFGGWPTGRS